MTVCPPSSGTMTLTYQGSNAGFENSLGYYFVDDDTGEITGVALPWENVHDLAPGTTIEIEVPPNTSVGTFIVADGNNLNDFSALGSGSYSFVDNGDPASLSSSNPQLVHTATDGTVTPITGNTWHSAGYGDNIRLNMDRSVHVKGFAENPDGTWTFGFEDLHKKVSDHDFDDVKFMIGGEGFKFLNPDFWVCPPPPCFVAGTLVTTRRGEIPVEQVRAGDMVHTLDNGWQTVIWAGSRVLTPAQLREWPEYAAVRIAADAFGPGAPRRDVMVSPQHRVLVRHAHAELLFGEAEVLVAAKHLLGRPGISRCDCSEPVHYVHLLCDSHEVLQTEGIWSESFQPGEMSSVAWDKAQRQELQALFPQLPTAQTAPSARPSLKRYEAAALFATGTAA